MLQESDITIRGFIETVQIASSYLKNKIVALAFLGLLGLILGFVWASFSKKTYTANMSFVVEESKSGGGLASLAGQFGLDLASNSNNGGTLLYGENLMIFLKSRGLIYEVLLSNYDSSSKKTIADVYAESSGMKEKWEKNHKIGKQEFFSLKQKPLLKNNRIQDSLLQSIIYTIQKKELFVERTEKKASFISVNVKMTNENVAKLFCEKLVDRVVEKYLQIKTKRLKTNVDKMQAKADSIENILNRVTFKNASQQETILDINPASKTYTVMAELSARDKSMLVTIYTEVMKNLEIAKMQLNQETPTIQIIDTPILPLITNKKSRFVYGVMGFLIFFGISSIYLLAKLSFKKVN